MTKYLKFWGTRGSCPVSGPEYIHFGGNTSCLEVRYDNTIFIIDAGTGIRPLGQELLKEKEIHLFLSHTHWDHLIGLPFFEPLYHQEIKITIWAPHKSGRSCRDLIGDLLSKEFFPVKLSDVQRHLEFKEIEEKSPIHLGPLIIHSHPTHHPGPTLCFKIQTPHEKISYVTDNEIQLDNQDFISFHKHADYFIHEAQYSAEEYQKKKGWGHSALTSAISLVEKVQPKRWLVTHHDPSHTDVQIKSMKQSAQSTSLPCPVDWVPDGHIIQLK